MIWLDTETKAILLKEDEPKSAPPKAGEFGLVLLRKGDDRERLVRAICRINPCTENDAEAVARSPEAVTINPGLSEAEALLGQFELICCDSIAVFVRSEVLAAPDQQNYLDGLFHKVLQSPEFQSTCVDVLEVPASEEGERFVDQFLGSLFVEAKRPMDEFSVWVSFKKTRMMKHWALAWERRLSVGNCRRQHGLGGAPGAEICGVEYRMNRFSGGRLCARARRPDARDRLRQDRSARP